MMKDTFFSQTRFMNLCRKNMVENWRANVLRLVLMYGILAVVFVWNGHNLYEHDIWDSEDPAWRLGLMAFIWGLWGFGCLSASFTMESMKSKTGRLSVLMTPATPFEKFFSRWMVSTVVFIVAFFIAYYLADYTRVLIYSLIYPKQELIDPVPLSHCVEADDASYYYLFRKAEYLVLTILGYFFVQSCFVLGSSIWPKNAFLKTFAAGVVITIVYVLIATGLAKLLIPDSTGNFRGPLISEQMMDAFMAILFIVLTLFNWTLAYFRFKESEIINRM